jgi:hypothetical protein
VGEIVISLCAIAPGSGARCAVELKEELAGVGAEMGLGPLRVAAGAGERGCVHRNAGKFVVQAT